ncbi:ornithine cyclodeaminase family protein [Planococcus lenghuensis]|uniref:Ornithine cyclodeaminase family protein n=1 Tax=Planococcus lenghuensis TaxID=2213202 RepID=A0A1Q2L2Z1_9BACL|nr:ornithine cyclodeaminase family protein [Planococcus lenghuensis]AQQ54810.1 hypothetical protein B0X71_18020 [Planococcus lenghuensis]
MKETLLFTREQIAEVLKMDDVIASVEEAYRLFSQQKVMLPPVLSFEVEKHHGEVDIKTGYDTADDIICVKIASGYANNQRDYGIPNGLATILIMDAKNSTPIAIMDGSLITDMRTGAAGAVSAKYLANPSAKKVAIVGTGVIARWELEALSRVFELEEAFVWGRSSEKVTAYIQEMQTRVGITYTACSDLENCVSQADIVITATSSKEALIQSDWIRPGTHIACIGADMPGKQELDEALFRRAKAFTDSSAQCIERGEVQHAVREGILAESDLTEIGQVILGNKPGRMSESDITVFDSTGLSVQDITTAKKVVAVLKERGGNLTVNLI